MGAGGNLFGRAISYVVNEFLVEGLANKCDLLFLKHPGETPCQTFQRFAVKTNRTLQELSAKAEQSKRQFMEQVKNNIEASKDSGR